MQRGKEVGCKVEACAECTKKCMLIHGKKKKDPSPIVTSFFKIMIGDRFSDFLFLPPIVARTLSSLVDQKTYLEDSSGRRWRVQLSNLNDSLAFQQGWHDFASYHNLEIGDFVVFNYIMESHFVVQIYSKSGGQRLNFSEEKNSSRRSIRTKISSGIVLSDGINSNATDGPCHMVDKGSMNKQGSSSTVPSGSDIEIIESQCDVNDVKKVLMATENTSRCDNSCERSQPVSTADYTEVPYYMIDRDAGYTQGEFRTSLFDLSNFEMFGSKSYGSNGANKVPMTIEKEKSHHADKSVRSQTTLEVGITDKDRVAEEGTNRVAPSDVSDFVMTEGKCNAEDTEKVSFATEKDSCYIKTSRHSQTASKVDPRENKKGNQDMSNGAIRKCTVTEKGNSVYSGKLRNIVKKEHEKITQEVHGKEPKVIQVEHKKRFNPSIKDEEKAYKVVKTERVDPIGLSSHNSVNFFCSAPTVTQSWLELPTGGLPSSSGMRMERKVVLLRDPALRLWPVIYRETHGFHVLASGWKALCKANNIQAGDVCEFRVESESEGLYRVGIFKK